MLSSIVAVLAAAIAGVKSDSGSIRVLNAPPADHGPAWSVPGPRPHFSAYASVDPHTFAAVLAGAPAQRFDLPLPEYGLLVDLPHPSGDLVPCFIAFSPVMEPGLGEKFPEIRTYLAQSIDGLASGRIELTPRGLTGMFREASDAGERGGNTGGTWMIDLWRSGDPTAVVAYWLHDLPGGGDWTCHTVAGAADAVKVHEPANEGARALQNLRIARLAVACTGEFGAHHSALQGHDPNIADPLAAIITMVSRTNVVFEADLGVHLNLVADNDKVVFINAVTDPYPDTCDGLDGSDCSSPILSANTGVLGTTIGHNNYDVGHCVTRIAGGVAALFSPCGSAKARGVSLAAGTSTPSPPSSSSMRWDTSSAPITRSAAFAGAATAMPTS